jgi:hypothetical protein
MPYEACARILQEIDIETVHESYLGADNELLRPPGFSSVFKCPEEDLVARLL